MSEIEPHPDYVGYPRIPKELSHGSIERLEALGKFSVHTREWLIPLLLIQGFFECGLSALVGLNGYLLLIAVLAMAARGIYKMIDRMVSMLAAGMGWRSPGVGKICGFTVIAITIVMIFPASKHPVLWLLPIVALTTGSLGLALLANREFKRYGVSFGTVLRHGWEDEFSRALERRVAWEKNPHPPVR